METSRNSPRTSRLTDNEWWERVSMGGGMKAGVGGEVSKYKNTPVSSSAVVERFFSEPRIFFVDDDSGLSATGPVRKRTEILWR